MKTRLYAPLLLGLCHCSSFTKDCTEMGCADGASLELSATDGALTDGAYTVVIALDALTHTCHFEIPADLPARGSLTDVTCEPALMLEIQQQTTCSETRTDDSVSESCTPIAGAYELTGSLDGTPEHITLTVSRDGVELLETSRAITYETTRPNGPDCEPVCRQATVEVTWDE